MYIYMQTESKYTQTIIMLLSQTAFPYRESLKYDIFTGYTY